MGTTRIHLGILLGLSLLALAGAKSLRLRRSVKGGSKPIQKLPGALESYPEIEEYPSKGIVEDPNWEPNYEDYHDDYKYTDESYLHSPNFVSSYEDDDDEEYDEDQDDYYDDIVYESDQNPIIVSIGNGVDDSDKIPYDVVDEDYDDKTKDPDFVPDYDEETPEDHEYDPDDDVDYDEDNVFESIPDDEEEDDIWASDDDPDYVPEEEYVDEDDVVTASVENLMMELAAVQALEQCQIDTGNNYIKSMYEGYSEVSKWEPEQIIAAVRILRLALYEFYLGKEKTEIDATASVKGKRQLQSAGQYSQQQPSAQIQQSGQVQYTVSGSEQHQGPIIVVEEDYDDKTKDPDYVPDYDAETPEDHEYDPEDDVDYDEEHVDESFLDDDQDDIWASDDDPDYEPEEEDVDEDDVVTDSLENLIKQLASVEALEQCQRETGKNYIKTMRRNYDEADWEPKHAIAAEEVLREFLYKTYLDQEKTTEIDTTPSVKGKRQFPSQQQPSAQIQQSGQVQYDVSGSEQQQGHSPIIVSIGGGVNNGDKIPYDVVEEDYDDKTKDPDYVPDYDAETPEDHEYDPDDDVDYDEEYVYESFPDDDEDDIWASDDDPDYVPEEEDADEDDVITDSLENLLRKLASVQALDQCQKEMDKNYLKSVIHGYYDTSEWEPKYVIAGERLVRRRLYETYLDKMGTTIDATASVKGKRQFKSAGQYSQQQQSGQIQQLGQVQYDISGSEQQQGEVGQIHQISEVSEGVEPLHPDEVYEVSSGVEAIDGEASQDEESGFFNWLGEGWGHVVNAADKVGDRVEDTFDNIGDKVSGAVDTLQDTAGNALDSVQDVAGSALDSVQDVAGTAVDKIQDAAQSARESVVDAYHSMKDKLPNLRKRIRHFFSKFGLMVQRGADYCVLHIGQAADQVREAQILDKLKQKLNEGNEQVAAFFTILGEKVTTWYETHGHMDVETGFDQLETLIPQEGAPLGEHTADLPDRETVVPNLFQDQDVVDQLKQMVASGVISQEDIDVFALQQMQSGQQVDPPQDPYPAIQVQTHNRRRDLRSKINVAKGHHRRH